MSSMEQEAAEGIDTLSIDPEIQVFAVMSCFCLVTNLTDANSFLADTIYGKLNLLH
jgi:hypothetical protein